MKTFLTIFIPLLALSACSESNEVKPLGPKPFISMGSNNSSETSVEIEEIVLDNKWGGDRHRHS